MTQGLFLKLQKPEESDVPIIANWLKDDGFVQNLYGLPYQSNTNVTKQALLMLNQNAKDTTSSYTLIAKTQTGEPIGLVMYQNLSWKHRNVEMNNAIGNPDQRSGFYGADLYLLGLIYAFNSLNLHKVFGYTYADNIAAKKLNQSAGKISGILKQHIFRDGQFKDILVFSIFKKDFQDYLVLNQHTKLRKFVQCGMFCGFGI